MVLLLRDVSSNLGVEGLVSILCVFSPVVRRRTSYCAGEMRIFGEDAPAAPTIGRGKVAPSGLTCPGIKTPVPKNWGSVVRPKGFEPQPSDP